MNSNLKLLTAIYQNAKIAIQSINDLMDSVKNAGLKKEISEQELAYQVIAKECIMISSSENQNLKDNNWFEKAKLWTSIKFSTFSDQSTSHLAEMMMLGTMMGMIDIIRELSLNKDADIEILELGKKLLETEENHITKLKKYIEESK